MVSMDRNAQAQYTTEYWSETRFFSAWSPAAATGIFIHAGRLRGNLDIWWTQTAVYLPDGGLAVDRQWTRNTSTEGVVNGNLSMVSVVPRERFNCDFDGVCEVTDTLSLATGPRGAGAPSLPVRWSVVADAAQPMWDMFSGHGDRSFASASHTQQTYTVVGDVTVGETHYEFDGFGYTDHSTGARDFAGFGGDEFLIGVVPAGAIHYLAVRRNADLTDVSRTGLLYLNGGSERVVSATGPHHTDAVMRLDDIEVVLSTESGRELRVRLDVLGCLPITVNDANDNINGYDWDGARDGVFFAECPVRITMPDGTTGYGHLERGIRRRCIDRQTLAVSAPGDDGSRFVNRDTHQIERLP